MTLYVRLYLTALENLIKHGLMKRKSKPDIDEDEEEDELGVEASRRRNMALLAIRCMSELLVLHPHFNYRFVLFRFSLLVHWSPQNFGIASLFLN